MHIRDENVHTVRCEGGAGLVFSFLIAIKTPNLPSGWRSNNETVLTQKTSEFKRTSGITQFNSLSSHLSDGKTQAQRESGSRVLQIVKVRVEMTDSYS